jgi:hypothetical protein
MHGSELGISLQRAFVIGNSVLGLVGFQVLEGLLDERVTLVIVARSPIYEAAR